MESKRLAVSRFLRHAYMQIKCSIIKSPSPVVPAGGCIKVSHTACHDIKLDTQLNMKSRIELYKASTQSLTTILLVKARITVPDIVAHIRLGNADVLISTVECSSMTWVIASYKRKQNIMNNNKLATKTCKNSMNHFMKLCKVYITEHNLWICEQYFPTFYEILAKG